MFRFHELFRLSPAGGAVAAAPHPGPQQSPADDFHRWHPGFTPRARSTGAGRV